MKRYRLDIEKSEITWTGFQPKNEISGKVYFKAGMVCTDEGAPADGEFHIDMRSIVVSDEKLDGDSKNKIGTHLKSRDFFSTDLYPTAILKIKSIKPLIQEKEDADNSFRITNPTHEVTASLTIKDSAHEIKFPVKIILADNNFRADVKLHIDRTLWNIDFMIEESFGEKKIKPLFDVDVKIAATVIDEFDA